MRKFTRSLVAFVQQELTQLADPAKAAPMQAYMKTRQPFYGVQKPEREVILQRLKGEFLPADRQVWEECVLALWALPHREEQYLAIRYAALCPEYVDHISLALSNRIVREGAWWDLVDAAVGSLVSPALLNHRDLVRPAMDRWVEDQDLWVRRAALLSQLRHKEETDEGQLFDHCLRRAEEREFFIAKAVGWALRDYSWTNPESVLAFLKENRERLAPLSLREGAKRIQKLGLL